LEDKVNNAGIGRLQPRENAEHSLKNIKAKNMILLWALTLMTVAANATEVL
jgi:hypothetical protein